MKNIETKTLVEIEGVIINDKIIETLKRLQDGDNEGVAAESAVLSDAICFISARFNELMDHEVKEAALILCELSSVRNLILTFKKP